MYFPCLWRKWITKSVSSPTTSVFVDGSPTYEFSLERELRQGDPLSPFLFLIVAKGLRVMMNAMVEDGLFSGYRVGSNKTINISHLQFVDDMLLLSEKSRAKIRALKAILILFKVISWMKLNFHMSMLVWVNVDASWLNDATLVLKYKIINLLFMYLGSPIVGDSCRLQSWYMLFDRIKKQLSVYHTFINSVKTNFYKYYYFTTV